MDLCCRVLDRGNNIHVVYKLVLVILLKPSPTNSIHFEGIAE
jgi:hypothetical protein